MYEHGLNSYEQQTHAEQSTVLLYVSHRTRLSVAAQQHPVYCIRTLFLLKSAPAQKNNK